MGHRIKIVDPFFSAAVERALSERNGRSVSIIRFAQLAGVHRNTVRAWALGLCAISRTTLQWKLEEDSPVGELARDVEKYYQLLDAKRRAKNIADCRAVHKRIGDGIKSGKLSSTFPKFAGDTWIDI